MVKRMVRALLLYPLRLMHRIYKRCVSPMFGNVCRFEPSCSDYALQAVEKHGFIRGGWLAMKRIIRCNPYCRGGDDPVP